MPSGRTPFRVENLTCEYAANPLGIDAERPRFAWQINHPRRGASQTSYRILVASERSLLASGKADLWDSGVVRAARSSAIEYEGAPLRSRQRCWWQARVVDDAGVEAASDDEAWFETAILDERDFAGEWLGFPAGWPGRALYFRRPFRVDRPVARARACVAGIGCHELRLNGAKVGDHVLDPAWTAYHRRVLYVTHDLTPLLRDGENVVGVVVGSGWHGMARLRMHVWIEHADGATAVIATGQGWQVGAGPIVANSLYDGEVYDARLLDPGWDMPGHDLAGPSFNSGGGSRAMRWTHAMVVDPPGGVLRAQACEPMRVVATLRPVGVREIRDGARVFDVGQNIAGWARVRLRGALAGTRVTLRFAESLRDDGSVNQDNLYVAQAADTYIARGEPEESYEPGFTCHGFRYVRAEGLSGGLDAIDLRVVRTAAAQRGEFACSNDLLNAIHDAVVRTEAGNLHGVPTDCPQRAERMGWLNDLTARSEQALMNFDLQRLYAKFVRDILDQQGPDGSIPDTIPYRWGFRTADPVCVAPLMLPLLLHQHGGDLRCLEEAFPAMVAWVGRLASLAEDDVLAYTHWGDWSEPGGDPHAPGPPESRRTPGALVSTAFLAFHARLLSRAAAILGRETEGRDASALGDRVAARFNERFWDDQRRHYGTGSQAANALALALGLAPPARRAAALDAIVRDVVDRHDGHLSTGNIATRFLLDVLSSHGRHDVACLIATQTTYPGWGFMLAHGATTIWERWEHATGGAMNSHNHPMLASVGGWLYRHVAGIALADDAVASDRFVFTPTPTAEVRSARASLQTQRGRAAIAWRVDDGETSMRVEVAVPGNATARLRLPIELAGAALRWSESGAALEREAPPGVIGVAQASDRLEVEIGSGDYDFRAHRA